MKITDFAVYKEDGSPWTLEEVQFICNSMGDNNIQDFLGKYTSIRKFCYKEPSSPEVYPWTDQDINGLTPITYNEYKQLVTPTPENLKPGTKVKIVSKWNDKTSENPDGLMDNWLGKTVTIKSRLTTYPSYFIEETGLWTFNIHCFECLVLPEVNYEKSQTKTEGKEMRKIELRYPGKSTAAFAEVMADEFIKTMTSKPKGKYLSLKIKNGVANARSLIYQAESTGIKDPRPFIQDIINKEKEALKQKIVELEFSKINYGYNIRLASLVQCGKSLQKVIYDNPYLEIDLEDCTIIYKLLDELAILDVQTTRAEETKTAYVCPYNWIAKFLTAENLNVPKAKELFHSNKLTIKLKDGWLTLHSYKEAVTYKIEIKLNVSTGEYYI